MPHLSLKHMDADRRAAVLAVDSSPEVAEPVLVTEREVLLGTAAAALAPAAMPHHHRLRTMLAAAVADIHSALPPPRPHYLRREVVYFEMARMARHMDHL
jgi:hypothetical protein